MLFVFFFSYLYTFYFTFHQRRVEPEDEDEDEVRVLVELLELPERVLVERVLLPLLVERELLLSVRFTVVVRPDASVVLIVVREVPLLLTRDSIDVDG